MNHRPSTINHRAFTLVELLIVVAILAALAALLFPSLGRARTRAKIVVCTSNLHQIGIAMSSYAGDYRDWFPAPSAATDYGGPSYYFRAAVGIDMRQQLRSYLQSFRVFCCPAIPGLRPPDDPANSNPAVLLVDSHVEFMKISDMTPVAYGPYIHWYGPQIP